MAARNKNKEEKISETNLTKWHVTGEAFELNFKIDNLNILNQWHFQSICIADDRHKIAQH